MARTTFSAYADRIKLTNWAQTQRATFTPSRVKTEVLAGLTVALALVPEAVAFAFVAGVEPLVGLYAAFLVGLITAVMGGRPGMISGATGALAVTIGLLVIAWMVFSNTGWWPEEYERFRSPFHGFMVTVVGTLSILLTGLVFSRLAATPESES